MQPKPHPPQDPKGLKAPAAAKQQGGSEGWAVCIIGAMLYASYTLLHDSVMLEISMMILHMVTPTDLQ